MKHAFIIQAHTQPELLCRVVDRLRADNHYFYIHVDTKSIEAFNRSSSFNELRNWQNVRCVESAVNVVWGGFSQIKATIFLLRKVATDADVRCDYVHFISGQDYPIVTPTTFDRQFENSPEKAWMGMANFEGFRKWHYRVDLWFYFDICHHQKSPVWHFLKMVNKIQRHLFKIHIRFRPPLKKRLYGESSWFSCDAEILQFIVNHLDQHPELEKRFHMTGGADEIFFHYILFNSEYADKIKQTNYRYIDWSEGKSSPKTLTLSDLPQIMASDAVLIRKVHEEVSGTLLDSIDQMRKG